MDSSQQPVTFGPALVDTQTAAVISAEHAAKVAEIQQCGVAPVMHAPMISQSNERPMDPPSYMESMPQVASSNRAYPVSSTPIQPPTPVGAEARCDGPKGDRSDKLREEYRDAASEYFKKAHEHWSSAYNRQNVLMSDQIRTRDLEIEELKSRVHELQPSQCDGTEAKSYTVSPGTAT